MEIVKNSEFRELRPISLDEVCVIGSVLYEDYKTQGSEGNIRGRQAIESLVNIAKSGCKAAFIIGENSDPYFVKDLKEELFKLGEKGENVVWHNQEKPGYSEAKREAIELARAKYPGTRAFILQEMEKDLTPQYENFVDELSNNKILVMMNRGVNVPYNENPWPDAKHLGANLPREQFWGERHQNIEMANQEKVAGLTTKEHTWDRLNGTRVIRNETVNINGFDFNPADLMLLKYRYVDGYTESDRENDIDKHSASTYNPIPILEALGAENEISEIPVKYWHSDVQKRSEESDSEYRAKRLGHKVDLPSINFDVVANIKEWKKSDLWPKVILNAVNGNKTLDIKHFDKREYSLIEVI